MGYVWSGSVPSDFGVIQYTCLKVALIWKRVAVDQNGGHIWYGVQYTFHKMSLF